MPRPGSRPRTATCWSSRRRSSRRPRAASSMSRPSSRRRRPVALAAEVEKDPRLVEVVLSESRRIVRHRPNLMIAEHRLGYVMANAGIDHSNVAPDDGSGIERVLLLPVDPDASAEALRARSRRARRQAHRGHRQRQFRPAVPPRHGRHRARRRRSAGGHRLARPARSVRPHCSKSPRPALPTRSPPPPRWCRARPTRRRRSCWCAASPGRRPTRPAVALVRPPEHDLFR